MKRNRYGIGLSLVVVIVLVGIPMGVVGYQAHRTGMTWSQVLGQMFGAGETGTGSVPDDALPKGEKIDFLVSEPIGRGFTEPPMISFVQTVDLDQDGLLDVLVCDCEANLLSWIRQSPRDTFTEQVLSTEVLAPAHVQAVDFDDDGDLDLILALLGMLYPNNDRIGSIVILENAGNMQFTRHLIIERIARVSDVRAADLDGDGDRDLAVAQFGYDDGETRWMENLGDWSFQSHMLQSRSGPIHCEVADFDRDGNLDIAVLVSQEWEEIHIFTGDGKGGFTPHQIFKSDNTDFGSSGMWLCDLDQDGDSDLLYTNGDAFDYFPPHPWPWHGVQWLENQGGLQFRYRRIARVGGAVGAQPADVDHDGDLDLFIISAFNDWDDPGAQSLIWLENNGSMRFRQRDISNTPTHLQALSLGDFDADGEIDLVTGGMHVFKPYDRVERIVLWRNRWAKAGSGSAGSDGSLTQEVMPDDKITQP